MTTQNTTSKKIATILQREGRTPHGWEIKSSKPQHCSSGMLLCYGTLVSDFDGADFLPNEVAEKLIAMGYTVPAGFVYKRTNAINGGVRVI